MRLISVDYSEHAGRDYEWVIQNFTVAPIMLIVGRNATGKTRTLNLIAGLRGAKPSADQLPAVWLHTR